MAHTPWDPTLTPHGTPHNINNIPHHGELEGGCAGFTQCPPSRSPRTPLPFSAQRPRTAWHLLCTAGECARCEADSKELDASVAKSEERRRSLHEQLAAAEALAAAAVRVRDENRDKWAAAKAERDEIVASRKFMREGG
jgi:hypothetical protein